MVQQPGKTGQAEQHSANGLVHAGRSLELTGALCLLLQLGTGPRPRDFSIGSRSSLWPPPPTTRPRSADVAQAWNG